MSKKPEALQVQVVVDGGSDASTGKEEFKRSDTTFGSAGGLRICFSELSYHVPSVSKEAGKERLYLLKTVSGFIQPHQMTALMGPSGSGKTTLLDVLAGRKNAGIAEGTISFGGQRPTQQFLRRYTGYVEQFDTLIGQLTVEEMLLYTAEMKRSMKEPMSSKQAAVDKLIQTLALESCRGVVIGNAMVKGISGGQAKRTNIGIALITNPRVLFLDEPTSGLDSYTSNEVMTVVKHLVKEGTTICATIHSPTSYCFNLFDNLLMLVKGQAVYFGPTKGSSDFARCGCSGVKEMTAGYNEAEFLVDFVTEADRQGRGSELAQHYANSDLYKANKEQLDGYLGEAPHELPESIQKELAVTSSTVTPWWWGLRTLIKYRTSRNYRDGAFLGPRIGDKILISLLIMTLYLGIGDNYDSDNLINIAAVLFMWCTLPAFGAAAYVPSLVLERNLFVRERADGMYHVITYLLAKMFDELLIAAVVTAIVAAWTFYGVQLQGAWVFFWLFYFATLCNGIVLAYFVAALSPNMDVANALLPTYVVTLMFFAGFLFRLDAMPKYWKWYSYIGFARYSWGGLMINQFTGDKGDPLLLEGKTVLQYYALDGASQYNYLGYMALFFLFFFMCAWMTLSFRKYQNR